MKRTTSNLAAAVAVLSLVLLQEACSTSDPGGDEVEARVGVSPEAAAFPADSPCAKACADTKSDENWAVCWSCQCKHAMDDWLPTPEEIGCAAGKEMEIFQMEDAPGGPVLKKVTTPVDKCLNPDRLRNHCDPGSRLVQVQHGDVMGKAICKRESFIQNYDDPNVPFTETGIILHNNRTGATCFYDDWDNVVGGKHQPDLDLTKGEPAKVQDFLNTYYRHEGEECISCHDNDPFMYSPHLSTTGWMKPNGYTFGPYHLVSTRNEPAKPVHKYLVSPDASACTSCHRISDGNTCRKWAADAAGKPSIATLQSWMTRDNGKWGFVTDERGFKWSYPYWMPDFNHMGAGMSPPATQQEWEDRYGVAFETISKCCANPSAPGCEWKDIPVSN